MEGVKVVEAIGVVRIVGVVEVVRNGRGGRRSIYKAAKRAFCIKFKI